MTMSPCWSCTFRSRAVGSAAGRVPDRHGRGGHEECGYHSRGCAVRLGDPGPGGAVTVPARSRTTYTETAPNVVGGRGTPGTMGACGATSWLWIWSEKPGWCC